MMRSEKAYVLYGVKWGQSAKHILLEEFGDGAKPLSHHRHLEGVLLPPDIAMTHTCEPAVASTRMRTGVGLVYLINPLDSSN